MSGGSLGRAGLECGRDEGVRPFGGEAGEQRMQEQGGHVGDGVAPGRVVQRRRDGVDAGGDAARGGRSRARTRGRPGAAASVEAVPASCENATTSPRSGGARRASKASRTSSRRVGERLARDRMCRPGGVLAGAAAGEEDLVSASAIRVASARVAAVRDLPGRSDLGADHLLHRPRGTAAQFGLVAHVSPRLVSVQLIYRFMLAPLPRVSLATRAYETLLDAIVTGALPPGERIRDAELAEQLETSRMPVREALKRLEAEGLVETVPNRETRVAPIRAERAAQAFPVIAALHALGTRLGVPALSAADDDRMRALDRDRARALERGDVIAAIEPRRRLPRRAAGGGGQRRTRAGAGAADAADPPARRAALQGADPPRTPAADHASSSTPAARRDADEAARLVEANYLRLGDQMAPSSAMPDALGRGRDGASSPRTRVRRRGRGRRGHRQRAERRRLVGAARGGRGGSCSRAGWTRAADDPHIAEWRAAFSRFGAKPKRYPCSAEALAARVIKGGTCPASTCWSISTTPSASAHLIPVGGEDLDHLEGPLRLDDRRRDEAFDGADGAPRPGEVVWRDDVGVTCRRWNWRQGTRTRLTDDVHARVLRVRPAPGAADGGAATGLQPSSRRGSRRGGRGL